MENEKKGWKNLFKKVATVVAGSLASLGLIGSVDNTTINLQNDQANERTVEINRTTNGTKPIPKLVLLTKLFKVNLFLCNYVYE